MFDGLSSPHLIPQETDHISSFKTFISPMLRMGADARARELVEPATKAVLKTHVEPKDDIARERARASFDTTILMEYLNGGKELIKKK
jgi:hypothetical protein